MTEAQRDGLCADLDVKHISVPDLLEFKSKDKTYPHADVLGAYLKEDIAAPADLIVSLVKEELEACKSGGSCYLLHRFPKTVQQFVEFERRVQRDNHMLLLGSQSQLDTEKVHERPAYYGPNISSDPSMVDHSLSRLSEPHVNHVRRAILVAAEDILTLMNRSIAMSLRISFTAN